MDFEFPPEDMATPPTIPTTPVAAPVAAPVDLPITFCVKIRNNGRDGYYLSLIHI